MKKKLRIPPLPPLSLKALSETEDIEEYARLSLRRCGDSRYYNTEKAVGIMCTCVIEVLGARIDYYQTLKNYHPQWLREVREKAVSTIVGLVGSDGFENWEFFTYHVDKTARQYVADRARSRTTKSPQTAIKQVPRTVVRDSYFKKFPGVKILDICWAAGQHYREWKRWIKRDLKDGSTPDLAFLRILNSGKRPEELKKTPRPSGWQ